MNPILWMLTGIGVTGTISVAFFAVTERDFREAIGQVLAALLLGPALLVGFLVRGGLPRAVRLSPEALALFAKQETRGQQSAWLLGYRGRGVIVVRRRSGSDWLNDVPNRATRASHDRRPSVRVLRDGEDRRA